MKSARFPDTPTTSGLVSGSTSEAMIDEASHSGFESAVCDHCGSSESLPYAELRDWLCGLPGVFRMVRCVHCGLLRLDPRPDSAAIARYYPNAYEPFADHSSARGRIAHHLQDWSLEYGLRRRVRLVTRFKVDGELLDVGCATGLFLDAARRLGGWEVQGVEPNNNAAQFGRRQLGLDIKLGTFANVDFDRRSFDVITMWDVLEHLHHPTAALEKAAQLLKDGGVLLARVPYLEGIGARLFGRYWAGLDAPRHLHVFPRSVLTDMLREVSLVPVSWQCWGSYHISALSVQFWLQARASRVMQILPWRAMSRSLPVRILTMPAFAFVDRVLGRGSAVTVVAQKRSSHWVAERSKGHEPGSGAGLGQL